MRRQYISYPTDMPLNISLVTIKNYPIHWHNSIEIIYVLKGKITIRIDTDIFELNQNKIEIINVDESHSLYSDEDNKVLIFNIDPYFFEKYYSDIENMFFYTSNSTNQESEEYDELRTYLSILLCEAVQKPDDYDQEIEETLIDILYHMLNNFNYLTYEKEELKGNDEQLERYHRISKFIFNNYNNNITLQDIANKEFLSTHYLSHEIKYATGRSFTDLLNLTRVEESAKLLLDTDKTISEISEDVGFSHTRYFNKHFKLNYNCTPLQFKKKYKVDEETYKKQIKIEYLDLSDALIYVKYYLEDYQRFNYDNRISKLNIKVDNEICEFKKDFKNIINVSDAFDLLIEDNKDILEEIQFEIGFHYARVFNIFSNDMGIYNESNFYNFSRAFAVFEFLESLDLLPLILLDNNGLDRESFKRAVISFLDYFNDMELIDCSKFKFQFSSNLPKEFIDELKVILTEDYNVKIFDEYYYATNEINYIYDTAYMVPFIIHNECILNKRLDFLRAFDVLDKQVNLTNEVFFGYPGIINDKGIKKPSYYAYFLINKLGDTLVQKGDGFIVTKKDSEYQILLYNYNDDLLSLLDFKKFKKQRATKAIPSKRLSINILGIPNDTRMLTYEINEMFGSSYNYWINMGMPKRLNREEKEILHKSSFPKISFKSTKKSTILNIQAKLTGYGGVLIIINQVQKHLK